MKRDVMLFIGDIWKSILLIEEYVKDLNKDEFYGNYYNCLKYTAVKGW